MHMALASKLIERVRTRVTQGDCPVEPALPVELLEDLVLTLAGCVPLTEAQIKHMVGRFLNWKLPEAFNPDGGISFQRTFNEHTPHPMKHEPSGTNLFDATQADKMVRYMLDGLPPG